MHVSSISSDSSRGEVVALDTRGILVSRRIEQVLEPIQPAVHLLIETPLNNEPWQLGHVPTESFKSVWTLIQSALGIQYVGESDGGTFCQIVVHESYKPWLQFQGYQIDFKRDPREPDEETVRVHGKLWATERAEIRFLENASELIKSGCPPELESLLCEIAHHGRLRAALEWTIFAREVQDCETVVRRKFIHYLVIIGLSLLETYDTFSALDIRKRSQGELLLAIQKDSMDVFRNISGHDQVCAEVQKISLVRALLKLSDGRGTYRQSAFNQKNTANDNANLYGSLIGITGSNCFGNFEPQKLLEALSKSNAFNDDDIRTLDIENVVGRMTAFLPIGFPEGFLGLPTQVLNGLSVGQVDQIRVHIAQLYRLRPSFEIPGNDVLVVLTWSSMVNAHPPMVLSRWAGSDDGVRLYRRLIQDLGEPHITEQLVLMIAALMCYKRHLPYTSEEATQSITGSHLEDFNLLMSGTSLSNERTVYEHMLCSLLRVLDTAGGEYHDIRQFLAAVFDTETPVLHSLDGFCDQCFLHRTKAVRSHKEAFEKTGVRKWMEAMSTLERGFENWTVVEPEDYLDPNHH